MFLFLSLQSMSNQDNENKPPLSDPKPGASTEHNEPPPQPPPPQPPPPQSNRTEAEEQICRKFMWGTCDKHPSQCRFKHIRDVELMKKVLKFCHDYQNHGCNRPSCSYLHITREEENLFLNFGDIPQLLLDRYAAMEARVNNPSDALMNNVSGYVPPTLGVAAPPPPPPPPPSAPAPPVRPSVPHLNAGSSMCRTFAPPPPPPPPQTIVAPPPPTMGPTRITMASPSMPNQSPLQTQHVHTHSAVYTPSSILQLPHVIGVYNMYCSKYKMYFMFKTFTL